MDWNEMKALMQGMDWNAMNALMWGGMLVSILLGVALIALIVAGVVSLLRQPRRHGAGDGRRTAFDHLEVRYARGEIDRETYLVMRRDLEADGR